MVVVDRKIINRFIALGQDFFVPIREMCHERSGRTADRGFDRRIDPFDQFGDFV